MRSSASTPFLARDTRESTLIDAVESGNVQLVRQLLSEGTSPNARKISVLTVNTGRWDRNSGPPRTDSSDGESALALAIVAGNFELVKALLEFKADPNMAISWQLSGLDPWTADSWNRSRWAINWLYPSSLSFAVGRLGRVTNSDGKTVSNWQSDAENALRLRVNKRGSCPKIVNPSLNADRLVEITFTPKIEIVSLLLRYGGKVSDELLDAARTLKDRKFYELLLNHRNEETEQQRHREEELRIKKEWEAIQSLVEAATQVAVSQLNGRIHALENKLDGQATEIAEMQRLHLITTNALQREIADLRQHVGLSSPIPIKPDMAPPVQVKQVREVKIPYQPREADEIELQSGQEVFVHLEYVDGWGRGLCIATGAVGYFPMAVVSESAGTVPPLTQRTASLDRPVGRSQPPSSSPVLAALPIHLAVPAEQGRIKGIGLGQSSSR
ncbi:hypothetical protein HDU93_006669 [Gonapodya sp. JEL0774]|nr:hypothetical protein HDU93_006669 [Gonapodya sp. JEL0774]